MSLTRYMFPLGAPENAFQMGSNEGVVADKLEGMENVQPVSTQTGGRRRRRRRVVRKSKKPSRKINKKKHMTKRRKLRGGVSHYQFQVDNSGMFPLEVYQKSMNCGLQTGGNAGGEVDLGGAKGSIVQETARYGFNPDAETRLFIGSYPEVSPIETISLPTNRTEPLSMSGGAKSKKQRRHRGSKSKKSKKTMKKRSPRRARRNHRKSKKYMRIRKHMKGGYHQFMSNTPHSAEYSVGAELMPNESALANPAPFMKTNHHAVDNYNHFLGKGSETGVFDQAPSEM